MDAPTFLEVTSFVSSLLSSQSITIVVVLIIAAGGTILARLLKTAK